MDDKNAPTEWLGACGINNSADPSNNISEADMPDYIDAVAARVGEMIRNAKIE